AEAVSLGIPTLSIPVVGQYEQELNARYLDALGYGASAPRFEGRAIAQFLERCPEYQAALGGSRLPRGNAMLFACVAELMARVEHGEKRRPRLDSPSMGSYAPEDEEGAA